MYTFVNGKGSHVGGAWTPLTWAIWIVATGLVADCGGSHQCGPGGAEARSLAR